MNTPPPQPSAKDLVDDALAKIKTLAATTSNNELHPIKQALDKASAATLALEQLSESRANNARELALSLDRISGAASKERPIRERSLGPNGRKTEVWRDLKRIAFVVVACGVGAVALVFTRFWWAAYIAIGLCDIYIVCMLLGAAFHGEETYAISPKNDGFFYEDLIPSRVGALVVVPLLFAAIMLGFAALYLQAEIPGLVAPGQAILYSFVTFTSADLANALPENATFLRYTVLGQLSNGILLLVGMFGLLVNRLANY